MRIPCVAGTLGQLRFPVSCDPGATSTLSTREQDLNLRAPGCASCGMLLPRRTMDRPLHRVVGPLRRNEPKAAYRVSLSLAEEGRGFFKSCRTSHPTRQPAPSSDRADTRSATRGL